MLKPAQLYKEELLKKIYPTWYDPRYIYYSGSTGGFEPTIPDNNESRHTFVSVDSETDEVLGYISYSIDWAAMSADRFGAISFDIGNLIVAKDMHDTIINLFEIYNMNRVSWQCFIDNPAYKGYTTLCKKIGGGVAGVLHDCAKLQDGKLHDSAIFEILRADYEAKKVGW